MCNQVYQHKPAVLFHMCVTSGAPCSSYFSPQWGKRGLLTIFGVIIIMRRQVTTKEKKTTRSFDSAIMYIHPNVLVNYTIKQFSKHVP